MSDVMYPIKFDALLTWMLEEYQREGRIFNIPEKKFFHKEDDTYFRIFGEKCETPIGPAAGPHTQVAQNLVTAYLTGGRFFELKTVQIMDELDIEKPCIDVPDEGYNTEWSTELKVEEAFAEYVKGWFLIHLANEMLGLSQSEERAFVFNMSVGYDLEGIKSPKIDGFIEGLKDASETEIFQTCRESLKAAVNQGRVPGVTDAGFVDQISPHISNSITLSTMHGCPPEDQEAICKYLIAEKGMHTFVKLNPTLHGYEYVADVFDRLGYDHINLEEEKFLHDMQYDDAVVMLEGLIEFAEQHGVAFGVKLSNTLAVVNDKGRLPTDEMYMSGRALYPLTINLAQKLSEEFDGKLPISYSGGANYFNIVEIFETGIRPITMATDLLKPGGYARLHQLAVMLEESLKTPPAEEINVEKLRLLANASLVDERYRQMSRPDEPMKIKQSLDLLDCFIAPCTVGCPIGQDVPEYIRLIGEERYTEALELIVSKNPLPFVTGFICEHGCQFKCVRNDYDDWVLIRDLKRIAAEKGFDEFLPTLRNGKPKLDRKVAVVGAGPAGLSSAFFLAREGFDVTVYDKMDRPGGMVAHGIPDFRFPRWALDKDIELIKTMGVQFEMNWDADLDVEALKRQGYDYVILAIGAWKSRLLNLGDGQNDVRGAIQFLQDFKADPDSIQLGKNVAVVGGGNSAMDGARAAKRVDGVEDVYIIYRRTQKQMPADREEFWNALDDGVIFMELLSPIAFEDGVLTCQVMELGEKDASGRRRPLPVEDEFVELEIDTVLAAIGELVDYDLLEANGIAVDQRGNIVVDENYQTSAEHVYIAGDAYRGPSSIVQAIADAQTVADGIFAEEDISPEIVSASDYEFDQGVRLDEIAGKKAVLTPKVAPDTFDDHYVVETRRCLECNLICNKCVEVCPNIANIPIVVDSPLLRDHNQILHLEALCNECGNCEVFCPYSDAPYLEKFTFFSTVEDFEHIENEGFVFLDESTIEMRYDGERYKLTVENGQPRFEDPSVDVTDELQALLTFIRTVMERYPYLLI